MLPRLMALFGIYHRAYVRELERRLWLMARSNAELAAALESALRQEEHAEVRGWHALQREAERETIRAKIYP